MGLTEVRSVNAIRVCGVTIGAVLALTSCAGLSQPTGPTAAVPSSPAANPTAVAAVARLDGDASGATTDVSDLTLGAGDLIEVSVFDVPEFSDRKSTRLNSSH